MTSKLPPSLGCGGGGGGVIMSAKHRGPSKTRTFIVFYTTRDMHGTERNICQ